jgi:hypothetical protein
VSKYLIALVVGLVALAGFAAPGGARPCRPGFPNCRRPHPPPPPPPPPVVTTVFQRVVPATPGPNLGRAGLARLLAGSAWQRLGSRELIRFVDPRRMPPPPPRGHFARPPGEGAPATPRRDRAIRAVAIDLVRDRHALLVNIDGSMYAVTACRMSRRAGRRSVVVMTTCLEHRRAGGAFGGQGYGGVTYGGR